MYGLPAATSVTAEESSVAMRKEDFMIAVVYRILWFRARDLSGRRKLAWND